MKLKILDIVPYEGFTVKHDESLNYIIDKTRYNKLIIFER
jgi:hypothetical protein